MINKLFPKLENETPLFIWSDACYRFALVEKGNLIKIYKWDQISECWNTCDIFEKIKGVKNANN